LLIGKSDTALLFGEKALNLSKQAFAKKEEVRAYGNLADYYLTKKEYSKGIDMLLRERELMSSLFSAEAAQATSEAMVRYETEKKEKQNQLLQQSNRIKNLELSKTLSENESKNKTIILLMISILLVALLAGFLIYRGKVQRNQQDQNAQFKIQNERIRISRDLHDNVGAQLSIVNSNVDWILSRKKQMTPDELSKRLSELKVLGSEVINTLRESIWAMKNDEISVQEFSDKIKTYLLRLRESSNSVQINFQEKMSNEHIILSPVIALNVFRITQEAINNALKYAGSGSVDVGLDQNGALLRVQILDRGEGFDVEKKKDGHYGLENMKQRALESGIELSIESVIGRGTTVQIIVGKNNASVV
jgi:signal transduction histidine kinase